MRYDHAFREKGYHSALLTTFSFDPIAWENVTLTTLKSAGCRNLAIIGDGRMVTQAFEDVGAPSFAGQSYHLAKRTLPKGCFHPKIVLQFGRDKGRIMIGSANLTTSGLSGNLEAISTISRDDENTETSGLFSALLKYCLSQAHPSDKGMVGFMRQVSRLTPWLKGVEPVDVIDVANGGRLGILTDRPESSTASAFVDEIGNDIIQQMIVLSAFWDENLRGLQKLRGALGLPQTKIIPDISTQDFEAATVAALGDVTACSPEPLGAHENRRLHGKLIICRSETADYVLTGSMNASSPGLWGRGEQGGNSEAAIFRKVLHGEGGGVISDDLQKCLDVPFPTECFRKRQKHSCEAGQVPNLSPDGGMLQIENGALSWFPAACRKGAKYIVLFGEQDEEITSLRALVKTPQKIDHTTIDKVRFARIIFEDDVRSAPTSIAVLDKLSRASEPPQKRHVEQLLADLQSARGFVDIYSLIGRLDALQHDEMLIKRGLKPGGSSAGKKQGDTTSSEFLDEDAFYEFVAAQEAGGQVGQFASLSELRRAINRLIGHAHDQYSNPDNELFERDSNLASMEELGEGETSVIPGNDPYGAGPDPEKCQQRSGKRNVLSTKDRKEALHFIADLKSRADQLKNIILTRPAGELPIDVAMAFQLIVFTVLSVASPSLPTSEYPLRAYNAKDECWVRILAKLLLPCCEVWSKPEMFADELEVHQVEALATLVSSVQILKHTIKADQVSETAAIPRSISSAFQVSSQVLEQRLEMLTVVDPVLTDRIQEMRRAILKGDHGVRLLGYDALKAKDGPVAL